MNHSHSLSSSSLQRNDSGALKSAEVGQTEFWETGGRGGALVHAEGNQLIEIQESEQTKDVRVVRQSSRRDWGPEWLFPGG